MLTGLLFLIGHQITVLESLWINDGLISVKKKQRPAGKNVSLLPSDSNYEEHFRL